MMLSFLRIRTILVCVLAGSLLFGCFSSINSATRFYILSPLDDLTGSGDEKSPNSSLSVEVASLRLPQYLDRPQIVTRSSGNRLILSENHQWGGNLRKNMIRVLAKNLSQLLATPNIAISPYRPRTPPDYLVELEVMKFEKDPDGRVRFSTQWRLSTGKNRKPLAVKITELESAVVQTGSDLELTVLAMSTLLGDVSLIISKQIINDTSKVPSE
jgi:uncharacterized lipoprotein YmbA